MEEVAAAAGVGKATLYRRYPDVASIALALLDAHERELQDRILRGPPPLGPGAPPADRLAAFYAAMVELLEPHGHLALAAEPGARRRDGRVAAWAVHVSALLDAAGWADRPAPLGARHALLAPLAPDVYPHQRPRGSRRPRSPPRSRPSRTACWTPAGA